MNDRHLILWIIVSDSKDFHSVELKAKHENRTCLQECILKDLKTLLRQNHSQLVQKASNQTPSVYTSTPSYDNK